ncbi:MAG: exodeoxyribonuclease III [Ignavibacteriales bacterium]|nr:exodeoxyribonuclease III [Ignavibacteriales bacterium]MCF8437478.1 exodeoxyribonuclease III [Ignavibacteriales bacterium]
MKIVSWNVNGIRAIAKKGFFEWFEKTDPDILCLQETKASPDQLQEELRNIAGYHSYFSSSIIKKGYSGVAIYSKKKPLSVNYGFGIPRFDDEGRIISAEFDDFTLINIYYPNGKMDGRLQYKMEFYDAFLDFAGALKNEGKNLVICGDFNTAHKEIDLDRPKENVGVSGFLPEERAWMDKFVSAGYTDTFRMFNNEGKNYTWWHLVTRARERNVGWRIDYFFVNDGFIPNVKAAYILPEVMGSDHCPVGVEIESDR